MKSNKSLKAVVPVDQELKKIGERLKYYRKKAGYSNYEYFAYEFGINRTQYGKYEAGKSNIEFKTLSRLIKALGISFEEFFKDFDSTKKKTIK